MGEFEDGQLTLTNILGKVPCFAFMTSLSIRAKKTCPLVKLPAIQEKGRSCKQGSNK